MRPEILKARMHGSVEHQPDSWNLIKYLIVYSSEHQPDSWNLLVMQVQNILKKKINKFYLKSPIPPLLCTTACRITFNDEDFCILTKNQQISKARHAPRSLSHAKEWHRLPRSMSAHQILQDQLMHNQLVIQGVMKISRRFLSSLILWLAWLPMQPATKRVYHILHQNNNPQAPNKPILLEQLMEKISFLSKHVELLQEPHTLRALRDFDRIESRTSGWSSKYSVKFSWTDCSTILRTSGFPNLVCEIKETELIGH